MSWMIAPLAVAVISIGAMVLAGRSMARQIAAQATTEESRMLVSTTTMIKRLEGLLGTGDLSEWEKSFVRSLVDVQKAGKVTQLTGAQVEKLDELYGRHFA
ncbi:hypothetical protein P3W85_29725 [Cupriavidus basilensis]|uniref:Uncharacterized protein n=1 Tax=Cupriavidus basilensis TaxID=68895 RepID=A0ABT6AXX7_9BURK|nr:hypothetical protein [Cupriavidus basilensis]MDF3837102.1 hypothetical protein [Cupriavidus basilensis]